MVCICGATELLFFRAKPKSVNTSVECIDHSNGSDQVFRVTRPHCIALSVRCSLSLDSDILEELRDKHEKCKRMQNEKQNGE